MFKEGDLIKAINIEKLPGKSIAPPLELDKEYEIISIVLDKKENQHINVGLESKYAYITSFETGEELPEGDSIHWCHPSRFELIK
ncbi:MAG TPA: hypothetical protein PLH46_07200 [Caldisericia bacterium]|nr:hypothetical protein [Caldisericia bacterium]